MSASARIAAVDLGGQLRGKRVAADQIGKAVAMPLSALNVDIFGTDIDGSPLIFETGDQDGQLVPTGRAPLPMPWLEREAKLDLRMMETADGAPFFGDPRQALIAALAPFEARGETVIAAAELEFYLIDPASRDAAPQPAKNPMTGSTKDGDAILSIRTLDAFEAFFNAIDDGAVAMGLPGFVVTSEAAPGQFEITLNHGPALGMADDIMLMKELIKGTARAQGMVATFLPKPFASESGTGTHVHCSVLSADGANVFDNGEPEGSARLLQSVAGLLTHLPASTAILAPTPMSFARFVENAHAPTSATWGYENRTVAIRIPGGAPKARRIEHRVAGGDVNPYLLLAVMLRAMEDGTSRGMTPAAPITGNAYDSDAPQLAGDTGTALKLLQGLEPLLGADLIDAYTRKTTQDAARLEALSHEEALWAALEVV